jgi:acetyl esterase/lipase
MNRRRLLAMGGAMLFGNLRLARTAEPPAPPAIPVPATWQNAQRLPLWPGDPPGLASFAPLPPPRDWPDSYIRSVAMPELRVFRPAQGNGSAILVMPGGAYWFVSVVNEGADLAPLLNARGFTVFVLVYRLPGEGWAARAEVPLQDAQRAMRIIRHNSRAYGVDPARVAALGFSAGGHLAATLATRHAQRTYADVDAADQLDPRPWATGLVYPVVTMRDRWTHELSRRLLLGEHPPRQQIDRHSAELHVDAATTPLFLCHAVDDTAVPVENSVRMMNAMRAARRPCEAHLLQEGGHAFGIGRPGTPSALWTDLYCTWLARNI